MVSNLNSQYLGGFPNNYYTNATNITSGTLNPSFGGTGLSSLNSGQILYATSPNSLGQTANLIYDSTNSNIKINQLNLTTTSQPPLIISNSNIVSNLNVQYLNGQPASYYTSAVNISGIFPVCNGGTGLSSLSQGFIPFGQTSNSLGYSSNLFWNNTSNFLGIGNPNPQYSVDVVGSVNVSQSLLINGISVNAGLQKVQKGGTGLSNVQSGYILFGQDSNQLNTSSNFTFNISSQQLYVPNASISSNLNISTSNLVSNLNAQYLNGYLSTYYTNATNISAGILAVAYGGTGLTSLQQGQLIFANSSNSFGQTSNVVYDQTNSNLTFNQANITLPASNTTQSPLIISNSNLVSNLNVQYLNSQPSSYYTNVSNVSSGVLAVTYGGTGLYSLSQGFIPFGGGVGANQISKPLSYSSNLFWDSTNLRLGIRTSSPQYAIDIVGNISCSNIYLSNQLISSIGNGTPPFSVASSTLVTNLNTQYLNGYVGSYYTNATNITSGTLAVSYGGTGLNTLSQGFIPFGQGSSSLGSSSNLCWNSTSNYLGIGNQNPQYSIDVVGSINVTQSLLINGVSVNAGLQVVQKGGTGLSNVQSGYILFGQDSNQLNTSSNLVFNNTNQQLLVSSISIISSLNISTSNLVSNLNAQYLNGYLGSYYTNATNISSGVLGVSFGGTGLISLQPGQLIFANSSNSFGQTSNVIYDQTNSNLKINQLNITLPSSNTSQAPFIISNSNLVSNLNVQYFNGCNSAFYTNASSINSGILAIAYGGTGLSSFQSGLFLYASASNTLAQTPNLAYDSTNSNIKINQLNITLPSSNTTQAPFIVSNSNLVSNLNAQLLNGCNAAFYTNAASINSGLLAVTYGGTGLSTLSQGFIPFGQGASSFGSTSNLFWDPTNSRLGINTSTPSNSLDVVGNIRASSSITTSNQFISTVATNTAPFSVTSTTVVSNLNAQQLNSNTSDYYRNAGNINAGTLNVLYGGTGLSSFQSGLILYASASNTLGQTPNLAYDSTNSNVKINQLNITLPSSNTSQAPFIVSNSNIVNNLNVQYLNSNTSDYYRNATNIISGLLSTSFGGTGLSSFQSSLILYANSSNTLSQTSNLAYDSTNSNIKINQLNITTTSQAPLIVSNSNVVNNLNVQYLNSNSQSYYTNATNIVSGLLNTSFGGTGLSSFQSGLIIYASSVNTLSQTSNLAYDSTNSNVKINQLNITLPSSNTTQSPFIISNSNIVNNLNVQYLNSNTSDYYRNATNIISGILSTSFGGTGLSSFQSGLLLYASGVNTLSQTSNIAYDSTNSNIKINQLNITLPSSNTSQAPFIISNSNIVSNLNVQYLNSNPQSYYTNATNIISGLLSTSFGGTGLSSFQSGLILYASGVNTLSQTSNLAYDPTNSNVRINQLNITLPSSNTSQAPFIVSNSNVVNNLNVQYLNSNTSDYYRNVTNINAGLLPVIYGGTGVNTMTIGYIHFGSSSGALGQSSNLFWNSTSNFLGVGTSNPISPLYVAAISNTTPDTSGISIFSSNINASPIVSLRQSNSSSSNSSLGYISFDWLNVAGFSFGMNPNSSVTSSNATLDIKKSWDFTGTSMMQFNWGTGFIGLRTPSPAALLDINASSNTSLILRGVSTQQYIYPTSNGGKAEIAFCSQSNTTSNIWQMGQATGATAVSNTFSLYSSTAGSNIFTALSNGYFGISTSSPTYPLDINGNTNIRGNLTITGGITATSTGTSSDFRLKTNSQTLDLQQQINFIKSIKPITFQWKNQQKPSVGFFAQDIIKSGINVDQLVNLSPYDDLDQFIDDDGFVSPKGLQFSLNYDGFVPIHTKILQHLLQQSDTYQIQIDNLSQQSQIYQQQINHLLQQSEKQQQQLNYLLQSNNTGLTL